MKTITIKKYKLNDYMDDFLAVLKDAGVKDEVIQEIQELGYITEWEQGEDWDYYTFKFSTAGDDGSWTGDWYLDEDQEIKKDH